MSATPNTFTCVGRLICPGGHVSSLNKSNAIRTKVPWNIPWNSMELCQHQIKCHKGPRNSMELFACHFDWRQVSLDLHWILRGTREWPNQMSPSFMELHGTWWLLIKMTPFAWLPLNFQGSMKYTTEFPKSQPSTNRMSQVPCSSVELEGRHCK